MITDTVKCFKLLGINILDDLRWDAHVDALCAKVASRLYFLKILKRSGLQQKDLLCFYKSVIRAQSLNTAAWYCTTVSTTAQSDRLEALQKRALRIILHPVTYYHTILPSLTVRWILSNCDDTISSRNSLIRFAIPGTACTTSSHRNVILLFLFDCGILPVSYTHLTLPTILRV